MHNYPQSKKLIVQVSDESFNFRNYFFDDPQIIGLQVANEVGIHPLEDYVILQWLKTHELENIRPAERLQGKEPFRIFIIKSDTLFRFMVDGLSMAWPLPQISAKHILQLLESNVPGTRLVLERTDIPDQVLEMTDIVTLSGSGVEKFKIIHKISIIVNGRPKEVYSTKISFEKIINLAFEIPPTGNNILFTVTYYKGPSDNAEGTMTPGTIIKIKEGMVFNVTATNRS